MKQELDSKLCSDFPALFRDRHAPMTVTCMCWGFPGDGWEPLLRNICLLIENALENARNNVIYEYKKLHDLDYMQDLTPDILRELKVNEIQVYVSQCKEKYGTLRFYWDGENLPERTHDEISGAVSMAEMLSASVCEECGERGEMRGPGWLSVRCDRCAEGKSTMKEFNAWVDKVEKAGGVPDIRAWHEDRAAPSPGPCGPKRATP